MLTLVGFLLIFACALGHLFFDSPRQQENRHITRLARESVKRTLRGKPKRGYRHVQAGWRDCP